MSNHIVLISALLVLLGIVCKGCEPPDCNRQDCGSCGNACCNMVYFINDTTANVEKSLEKVFKNGGPDGRYTLQPMYEGGTGFADLRPYNASVDFIGQAWHTTATAHFNDTMDMTIAPTTEGGSWVKIFSISQIGGAYCDSGQGYKNIIQLVKALNVEYTETNVMGCPAA